MKVIDIKVPKICTEIEIIPISDIHYGDPLCNLTLLTNIINYIKNNDNVYCILNGDLINSSTISSIASASVYNEISPQEQIAFITEQLKKISNKILAITGGNHEDRAFKSCGIDSNQYIADMLGIADRYCNTSVYIFLTIDYGVRKGRNRSATWGIWMMHGSGGGKKVGAKANQVEAMSQVVDADIYIHSHTHQMLAFKQDYISANNQTKTLKEKTRLFINTNAFLKFAKSGDGGYAEKQKYAPSTNEIPRLIIGVKHMHHSTDREKYMLCKI